MLVAEYNTETLFAVVEEKIKEILSREQDDVPAIEPDSRFSDIGLSSLDLAELVADLEMELNVDPFEEAFAITDISNVFELCQAYLHCLEQAG